MLWGWGVMEGGCWKRGKGIFSLFYFLCRFDHDTEETNFFVGAGCITFFSFAVYVCVCVCLESDKFKKKERTWEICVNRLLGLWSLATEARISVAGCKSFWLWERERERERERESLAQNLALQNIKIVYISYLHLDFDDSFSTRLYMGFFWFVHTWKCCVLQAHLCCYLFYFIQIYCSLS